LQKLQKIESQNPGPVFTDKKFMPEESSLIWRRSKEFLNDGPIQVFHNISPASIIQGSLGDCYLLSSLSVLSENQDYIRRLFITREYQANGMYALWLSEGGKFKLIVIDDYFPCFSSNSGPAYSK
jgi:hypothetical protein